MKLNFWQKKGAEAEPNKLIAEANSVAAHFLKDRDRREHAQKIILQLVEQTQMLTQQEISRWRAAWQRAISVENPTRTELLNVYSDVDVDNHLIGVFGQIYKEVLQKAFKIVDRKTGEEIPELSAVLEDAQWFIDFCSLALESKAWGYSLVQFGDVVIENGTRKFSEVELVNRWHVIPDKNVFVALQSDHWSNGFDFSAPPYNAWCIGIGQKKDLGLYNKVARHAISKKNVEAFWDKFAQIFGMPIRIGKTASNNVGDRNAVADMLQKMGSAAWGVFPDGTDIEIKETTRGDAFEVYDRRIDRANSEMSKAIVHQTMTSDNGSSKSQSETHLTVQEKVIEYFATFLRITINDKLIPFMTRHGFAGFENARFAWDDTVELTSDQQKLIEEMILNKYEVDPEYFITKYNIPITGSRETKPANQPGSGSFFD
jgi:Protein of unknown function (DUF935)